MRSWPRCCSASPGRSCSRYNANWPAHGKLTRSAARHRVLDELAFVLGDEATAHRPGRKLSEDDREIRRLLPDFLRTGPFAPG